MPSCEGFSWDNHYMGWVRAEVFSKLLSPNKNMQVKEWLNFEMELLYDVLKGCKDLLSVSLKGYTDCNFDDNKHAF